MSLKPRLPNTEVYWNILVGNTALSHKYRHKLRFYVHKLLLLFCIFYPLVPIQIYDERNIQFEYD
jgi:hypothetical protein